MSLTINMNKIECLNRYMGFMSARVVTEIPVNGINENETYIFHPKIARQVSHFTHGFHKYPAKFIPQIPQWAFKYDKLAKGSLILDPFCGSGTTLVEARLSGFDSIGYDINPLATLMSRVKSTPLFPDSPRKLLDVQKDLISFLRFNEKNHFDLTELDLPENWPFWFEKKHMMQILKIKYALDEMFTHSNKYDDSIALKDFFTLILSSIIKKISYFDEKQIKVKKDSHKFDGGFPDGIDIFAKRSYNYSKKMIDFTIATNNYPNSTSTVMTKSCDNLELPDESVDLIVTSPPYINAIDYAHSHKYNLFLLGLILPQEYQAHCKEYIGVTERAILKKDYNELKLTGFSDIDSDIEKIYNLNKKPIEDMKRAYIMYQYFSKMEHCFQEFNKKLKENSRIIMLVGDNKIRGNFIPTSDYLIELAESAGFKKKLKFYHKLRAHRLGIERNTNAGKISADSILVFTKN